MEMKDYILSVNLYIERLKLLQTSKKLQPTKWNLGEIFSPFSSTPYIFLKYLLITYYIYGGE